MSKVSKPETNASIYNGFFYDLFTLWGGGGIFLKLIDQLFREIGEEDEVQLFVIVGDKGQWLTVLPPWVAGREKRPYPSIAHFNELAFCLAC